MAPAAMTNATATDHKFERRIKGGAAVADGSIVTAMGASRNRGWRSDECAPFERNETERVAVPPATMHRGPPLRNRAPRTGEADYGARREVAPCWSIVVSRSTKRK